MDFSLTAEQEELAAAVRKLMTDRATEQYIARLDDNGEYPYELYDEWVKLGLLQLPFPTEFGGLGGSVMDFVVVAEELGRFGYDFCSAYGVPVFNGLNVVRWGTDEQKADLLPRIMDGRVRLSISMTEPDAGSDAGAMRTTAVPVDGGFRVNGTKIFASAAGERDNIISLYCCTDPDAPSHTRALSCLLVDSTTPGLTINPLRMLGRKLTPTTELVLDDVFVPEQRLLGPLHGGWKVMLSGLNLERIVTSAAYVGNTQIVVDEAVAYAQQRHQFGRPIGSFQAVAHQIADMQVGVDAARLLTYKAAWMLDQGLNPVLEISQAKLFGSEAFRAAAITGLQVLGGYGYSMESPMQRHLRSAVGSTITGGTSEMQRTTIARRLGLDPQ